jgi:hypothetical protein
MILAVSAIDPASAPTYAPTGLITPLARNDKQNQRLHEVNGIGASPPVGTPIKSTTQPRVSRFPKDRTAKIRQRCALDRERACHAHPAGIGIGAVIEFFDIACHHAS